MSVRVAVTALVSAVVVSVLVAGPATAAPGDCIREGTEVINGQVISTCLEYEGGGGTSGDDSDGGSDGEVVSDDCDLSGGLFNEFCIGTARCFVNDPAAVQDLEKNGLSEDSRPSPDSYPVYWQCQRPNGEEFDRYYWNDDQPVVSIADRIRAAVGVLQLPTISASFNPPTRTLVNLPTWWWAVGAPAAEIRGTEALGLRAVATPRGLSIEPGDGTGSFTCPMSVTKSDTCTHEYRRAGDYTASVSIVYDLTFEIGGNPVDAAEVPADLRTLTVDDAVDVPVREVQSRVTELG